MILNCKLPRGKKPVLCLQVTDLIPFSNGPSVSTVKTTFFPLVDLGNRCKFWREKDKNKGECIWNLWYRCTFVYPWLWDQDNVTTNPDHISPLQWPERGRTKSCFRTKHWSQNAGLNLELASHWNVLGLPVLIHKTAVIHASPEYREDKMDSWRKHGLNHTCRINARDMLTNYLLKQPV